MILKFAAITMALSLAIGVGSIEAAAAKKSKRDSMSAAQKTALRKKAREWCLKQAGVREIARIEIKSTGRVVCWYY